MELPFSSIAHSENETAFLAVEFSKKMVDGDIVLLNGDLGTGKTFFVKSLCKEFGIENVSSPSFSIVNEYLSQKKIYHFDFYRIRKAKELLDIGFNDYLTDEAIVLIEWAEMYPEILPKRNYEIKIDFINDTSRKITIKKNG